MPLLVPGSRNPNVHQLCQFLEQAEERVRSVSGERLMDGFDTNADFANFINDARSRIASDRFSWIGASDRILAPTKPRTPSTRTILMKSQSMSLVLLMSLPAWFSEHRWRGKS